MLGSLKVKFLHFYGKKKVDLSVCIFCILSVSYSWTGNEAKCNS